MLLEDAVSQLEGLMEAYLLHLGCLPSHLYCVAALSRWADYLFWGALYRSYLHATNNWVYCKTLCKRGWPCYTTSNPVLFIVSRPGALPA